MSIAVSAALHAAVPALVFLVAALVARLLQPVGTLDPGRPELRTDPSSEARGGSAATASHSSDIPGVRAHGDSRQAQTFEIRLVRIRSSETTPSPTAHDATAAKPVELAAQKRSLPGAPNSIERKSTGRFDASGDGSAQQTRPGAGAAERTIALVPDASPGPRFTSTRSGGADARMPRDAQTTQQPSEKREEIAEEHPRQQARASSAANSGDAPRDASESAASEQRLARPDNAPHPDSTPSRQQAASVGDVARVQADEPRPQNVERPDDTDAASRPERAVVRLARGPDAEKFTAPDLADEPSVRVIERDRTPSRIDRNDPAEPANTSVRVALLEKSERATPQQAPRTSSTLETEHHRIAPQESELHPPWEQALGDVERQAQRESPELEARDAIEQVRPKSTAPAPEDFENLVPGAKPTPPPGTPEPKDGLDGALLAAAQPTGNPNLTDPAPAPVPGVPNGTATSGAGGATTVEVIWDGPGDPPQSVPVPASPLPLGGGAGIIPGTGDLARGDPNDALVLERITHVVSLFVGDDAIRAHGRRDAKIRFEIDARGYVQGYELRESSHVREFDEAIEPILHLAEPFPVAQKSYELALPFAIQ